MHATATRLHSHARYALHASATASSCDVDMDAISSAALGVIAADGVHEARKELDMVDNTTRGDCTMTGYCGHSKPSRCRFKGAMGLRF